MYPLVICKGNVLCQSIIVVPKKIKCKFNNEDMVCTPPLSNARHIAKKCGPSRGGHWAPPGTGQGGYVQKGDGSDSKGPCALLFVDDVVQLCLHLRLFVQRRLEAQLAGDHPEIAEERHTPTLE